LLLRGNSGDILSAVAAPHGQVGKNSHSTRSTRATNGTTLMHIASAIRLIICTDLVDSAEFGDAERVLRVPYAR
jgi:hypothetical protein